MWAELNVGKEENAVASGTDAKPAEQKGDFKIFALNNILQLSVLQVSFCRVQYTRMNVRVHAQIRRKRSSAQLL